MPILVADRVQETSNTTGTGTITLAGALAGYQSFSSAFASGGQVYYGIVNGVQWEIGIGTFTVSGTTLARNTVLASSNGGSQINLSGASNVFCDFPAVLAAQLTNANGTGSVVLTTGATLVTPNIGAANSTAVSADGYNLIGIWANATAAQNASLALKSSRGTVLAPAATQTGDVIGALDVFGYTGTAYNYAASFDVQSLGVWSGTSTPTQINFNTTAVGATVPTQTMNINSTQINSLVAFHTTGVDANFYALAASSYNSSVNGTGIQLLGARGTVAAPTATLANDILGNIDFYGFGTAATEGAAIDAIAGSNWTVANAETFLSFWTTPNASVVSAERMRILSTGAVSVGTTIQATTTTTGTAGAGTGPSLFTVNGALVSLQTNAAAGYNYEALGYSAANTNNAAIALKSQTRGAAACADGDTIGVIDAFGWQSTAYNYCAAIDFLADGAWSPTASGSKMQYWLTASGGNVNALAAELRTSGYTVNAGILATGIFGATYTDGTVVDYTTGIGRISVGAADALKFYNGGIATTLMATLDSTGLSVVGGTHSTVSPEVAAATYTQVLADSDLLVNFAGTVTLTLLNPATYPGRYLTIRTYQAQLVNSATANVSKNGVVGTAILAAVAGAWATLKSDGVNWEVITNN